MTKDEKEIIRNGDILVQLNLLSDEKNSLLRVRKIKFSLV